MPVKCKLWVFPVSLIALAFLARLIGIGWGLPNETHYASFHPDEGLILAVCYDALNPFRGEFLPGFYNYGTLSLYLWSFWLHLLTFWGVIAAPPAEASEAVYAAFRADLHLWARILTAFLGALTVGVIYQTGHRLGGQRVGLWCAAAILFAPAHVIHSRFQTVDVPTTLFVALICLQAVKLYRSEKPWRDLMWGAVWAGCAAGCKYNAGLFLVALWVSAWLRPGSANERGGFTARAVFSSAFVALMVFALVCPGLWADNEQFMRHFTYELRHVGTGHGDIFTATGLGWLYHLSPNLAWGFGTGVLLLSVAGWAFGWKSNPAARGILIASILFYLLIGGAEVRFLRYTFPLYPALALGIGFIAPLLASQFSKNLAVRQGASLAVSFAFVWQWMWSFSLTTLMIMPDTRLQCVQWMKQNAKQGDTIGFGTVPWFYTPPLFPQTGELRWQDRLQRMAEAQTEYRLVSLAPPDWDTARLKQDSPDWVIMSQFEFGDMERLQGILDTSVPENDLPSVRKAAAYQQFMGVLSESYEVARVFRHRPPASFGQRLPPHDLLYIYPEMRVYRRK